MERSEDNSPAPRLGVDSVVAERYRLLRRLGSGGMAEVYEAEHVVTRRHLALKLLRPEVLANPKNVERFYREASVCSGIDSDHIVAIVDCDVDKASDVPFMVMELLQGEDLAQYIARANAEGTGITPSFLLTLLKQVASALDKVHAQGIVHRDLKPANLFLTFPSDGPPRVKILDFGIATLIDEEPHRSPQGRVGTPLYMAPELLLSGATITPSADLYALGLIAYELMVGHPYWEGNTATSLFAKIPDRQARPRPTTLAARHNVSLPPAIDAWLLRCLDPDPARRPASAGAAVGDLVAIFDPTATQPPRADLAPAPVQVTMPTTPRSNPPVANAPAPKSAAAGAASTGGAVASGQGAARPAMPRPAPRVVTPPRSAGPSPARSAAVPLGSPREARPSAPSSPVEAKRPAAAPIAAEVETLAVGPTPVDAPSPGAAPSQPPPPPPPVDARAPRKVAGTALGYAVVAAQQPRTSVPPPTWNPLANATPSIPPSERDGAGLLNAADEEAEELRTDDLEDLKVTAELKAAVTVSHPVSAETPFQGSAVVTERLLDDGLSEKATRKIVSRLKSKKSDPAEAVTRRIELGSEALTQRMLPVVPTPRVEAASPEPIVEVLARAPAIDPPPAAPPAAPMPLRIPLDVGPPGFTTPGGEVTQVEGALHGDVTEAGEPEIPGGALVDGDAPPVEMAGESTAVAIPRSVAADGTVRTPSPQRVVAVGDVMSARIDAVVKSPDAQPSRRRIPRSVELASTTILPTKPPVKGVSRLTLVAATVGTLGLASLAGWVLLRDRETPAAVEGPWRGVASAEQATLSNVSRDWSATLLRGRTAQGFAETAGAGASGLETARSLAGLLAAHRASLATLNPELQLQTLVALDRLRGERGWTTLAPNGTATPSVMATAWAALAYSAMCELTHAETARVRVRVARDALIAAQRDDGAFSELRDSRLNADATVLGAWALVAAAVQDPTAPESLRRHLDRSLATLRAALDGEGTLPSGWSSRHEALAVLALLRARAGLSLIDREDNTRFQRFVTGLLGRCAAARGSAAEVSCSAVLDDPGLPRASWWAWSMAASGVLLRTAPESLDPASLGRLSALVRGELSGLEHDRRPWAQVERGRTAELLAAMGELGL
ncbi:MAG: protein kinase [Myxococcales bacterium]|nr:protein kinase [Myxococcales bacterium]